MLNLDDYANNSIQVCLKGKTVTVMEPSVQMFLQVDKLEKDLTEENLKQKRVDVALLFLNYNKEGVSFKREDIENIPFEGVDRLVMEIAHMRLEADSDPN